MRYTFVAWWLAQFCTRLTGVSFRNDCTAGELEPGVLARFKVATAQGAVATVVLSHYIRLVPHSNKNLSPVFHTFKHHYDSAKTLPNKQTGYAGREERGRKVRPLLTEVDFPKSAQAHSLPQPPLLPTEVGENFACRQRVREAVAIGSLPGGSGLLASGCKGHHNKQNH